MPTKLRNIIFTVICICALSVAFIYQGAKVAHVLPSSFNNGTYSYLEGAKLQTRPKVSLENIKKGTFQSQTEKWITTKVPKRDSVMLFNAKVQRGMIRAANLACGFETIPTFYGSSVYYYAIDDALFMSPAKQSNDQERRYENCADELNNFSKKYKNLSVNIGIIYKTDDSEFNPVVKLISNPIDHSWTNNNFIEKLDESINYVDLYYSDESNWRSAFFRTDHHWTISGATDAYKKIMESCFPDLNQIEFNNKIKYDEIGFNGSYARRGAIEIKSSDKIEDYVIDLQEVAIQFDDDDKTWEDVEHTEKYGNRLYSKHRFYDLYSDYFHSNQAKIVFTTQNQTNRNLLLIGESFLNNCERFYVPSFDKVIHVDPNYFKDSLEELIEKNCITDVLILEGSNKYWQSDSVENLTKLLAS